MQKELFPREMDVAMKQEDADDADENMEDNKDSVNTPTAKKGMSNVPRTPTPFKNALNEIRKIHGQPYVPSSPNGLVEDITEIMNQEAQQDSTMDSTYETDSSVLTSAHQTVNESSITTNTTINTNTTVQNITNPKRLTYAEDDSQNQHQIHPQQLQKKAKKSLESSWSTAANTTTNTTMTTTTDDSDDFPYLVETPVCTHFLCFMLQKQKY